MKLNVYFRIFFQPGSRFGLSLLLNAEQYEYMSGPQNDAGVKVGTLSSNLALVNNDTFHIKSN